MSHVSYSDYVEVVFHDGATAAANGTDFKVDYFKTLTVEIFGSSDNSARTVTFYGKLRSGTLRPISGMKLAGLTTALNTTGTGELWQFDITGLESVVMDLTSITDGKVSVIGKAVA
jgi:hypothetical protein